jgi:putative SOS response-associated peptidase YedK
MCGRYTITHSTNEILERFQALCEGLDLSPNYNVAPSQVVPIVVAEEQDAGAPIRHMHLSKWGLLPFWARDEKVKPMINARAETVATKGAFKQAFKRRRCIVPAESFYEWKRDNKRKIPVRIRLSGEKLMGFAGIYEDRKNEDGTKTRTCAIITVPANELMERIHDRMPAILTPAQERIWLDPTIDSEQALAECLRPYPSEDLEAYIVSNVVNSARVNGPECIKEASADYSFPLADAQSGEQNADQRTKSGAAPGPRRKTKKAKDTPEENPDQLTLPL